MNTLITPQSLGNRAVTPPPIASPNPHPTNPTPNRPASASNHLGQTIPATENENAYDFVCGDMKGKYVTVSAEDFLKMLPEHEDLPDSPEPPDMSGLEPTHHDKFIRYMRPFVNQGWELVNTSSSTDREFIPVLGVSGVKPDLVLYSFVGATTTAMRSAESFGELKTKDEPFRDENDKVVEVDTQSSRLARGQITIYSTVILSSQQRTRVFSFYVREHLARLLCHSRAGFLVTPLFNYVTTTYLREFFWRYTHASYAERGHDDTMQKLLKEDDYSAAARAKLDITASKPLFKVKVGGKVFYVSEPFLFRHNQPIGRGTRCFEAYNHEQKCLVLLKDTWRHIRYRREGEVYAELHKCEVPNILQVIAEGDVTGNLQRTKMSTGKKDDGEMVHYRIVLAKVGRPLNEFTSTYELVKGVSDAFEAHYAAWSKAEMLHRDISFGNILLGPIGDGPKGYLIDWEFAKKKTDPDNTRERTGTYEFMSRRLLEDIGSAQSIRHEPEDDIESFVYVLIWTVLSHAKSELPDEKCLDKLRAFDRVQNTPDATAAARKAIIIGGVEDLKISSNQLQDVLRKLFRGLSNRLIPRATVLDNILDVLQYQVKTDESTTERKMKPKEMTEEIMTTANTMADERIERMATHEFMSQVLLDALKDEKGIWKNQKDAAVSRDHGSGNKRKGVTMVADGQKRLKSSSAR
ncbi:hypothetical protein BT69DRAFT_1349083 [Atractiella rhizophila]|nr:hypothetical protein BT69DRAFT_1349083 [Atractiella rhizophila]